MLYLVLVLVVASLGLLIAALTTANTLWAWLSVLISVVAAGLLVLDWIQNRRKRRSRGDAAADRKPDLAPSEIKQVESGFESKFEPKQQAATPPLTPPLTQPPVPSTPPEPALSPEATQQSMVPLTNPPADDDFDRSFESAFGDSTSTSIEPLPEPVPPPEHEPVTAVQAPAVDASVEPDEEATDATDLLVVSELSDEVVVIDERPRYHLTSCAWLNSRPTMGLPVSEARELGFTPCALCSPDTTLAARQRARS